MKKLTILTLFSLLGFFAKAQNRDADFKAIQKQVQAMAKSWNKHDHSDMKNYTTADCDWVNIVGMWWKGRKQVEYSTQFYHENMFKTTPLSVKNIDIRFISNDVALVHSKTHVGKFTTPDGHMMPEGDDLALLVYVKQNGIWLLTAGENVVVDNRAQKNDPVLHMPKN